MVFVATSIFVVSEKVDLCGACRVILVLEAKPAFRLEGE